MPKYTAKITVPVANDKLDPVEEDLNIGQGRISQVSVTWTPGSQWSNALVVKFEGAQIIPSEGGGECRGNGFLDTWPEHIDILVSHPVLNIEAWNEGNDYEHEVILSIVVLPIPEDSFKVVRDLVAILKRMIGL